MQLESIVSRLAAIEEKVANLASLWEASSLEAKVDRLLHDVDERKRSAAQRKRQYKEARERREHGKIALPAHNHVLKRRDPRIEAKLPEFVDAGYRFAAADDPEGFAAWLVYQWNSCTYLKKPITFSGGYYRVYAGGVRCPYGAFDLMGYNKKQKQLLRHQADYDDFGSRPWWDWCYIVLFPVWERMVGEGRQRFPKRFERCVRVLLGDYGECKVSDGLYWGQSESMQNINRMLRTVGTDLWLMWKGCLRGLRSQSEIPLPKSPEPARGPAAVSHRPRPPREASSK